MIALLAAVPDETRLLKKALEEIVEVSACGMTFLTGRLCGHSVCLTHGGVGKAAAAAATITLLTQFQPECLLLFGCGGAYPDSGLKIGDLALASVEIFGDEGVATPHGFDDFATMGLIMRPDREPLFNTWPLDEALHDRACPRLQHLATTSGLGFRSGPFVTVSTCTGTAAGAREMVARTGALCENMEGAAVALACRQLSVPMLELRGISNRVEDRDTRQWDLTAGMAAAQNAVKHLLDTWPGPAHG